MLLCSYSTTFFSVVFLLVSSCSVYGWGQDGHALVAAIAQTLLTDNSTTFVRDHLPPDTNGNMSMVASWADDILYNDTDPFDYIHWQWSKQLHYVNTKDWLCAYDRQQDCNWTSGQQCVDGSIQNYTGRLADSQLDDLQRLQALQFLIHFIGDAHQPLHAGFQGDRGGNEIEGFFFGTGTNLHKLWDTGMIERRISEQRFHNQPSLYLEYLLNQMKTTYAQNISDWTQCSLPDESRYLACSTAWIVEDVNLDCESVYRDEDNERITVETSFNLSEIYYETRMVALEQRLIQGGVRLAAVINKIVQSTNNDNKSNTICLGTLLLMVVIFVQSILILTLLSYILLRRKPRPPIRQPSVFSEKKEYLVIA